MPNMSGKTALLELLRQEGVRMIFGNPGTTELPLMDALAAERELRYILALQEAAQLNYLLAAPLSQLSFNLLTEKVLPKVG